MKSEKRHTVVIIKRRLIEEIRDEKRKPGMILPVLDQVITKMIKCRMNMNTIQRIQTPKILPSTYCHLLTGRDRNMAAVPSFLSLEKIFIERSVAIKNIP